MRLLRSLGFWVFHTLMNVGDRLISIDVDDPISWRDRLGWFLHDCGHRVFALAYSGSDEELSHADLDMIPWEHMSTRQREHVRATSWSLELYRGGVR